MEAQERNVARPRCDHWRNVYSIDRQAGKHALNCAHIDAPRLMNGSRHRLSTLVPHGRVVGGVERISTPYVAKAVGVIGFAVVVVAPTPRQAAPPQTHLHANEEHIAKAFYSESIH